MREIKAKVIVTVVVEVDLGDNWREECTVEKIYKDAREDALNKISRCVAGKGLANEIKDFKIKKMTPTIVVMSTKE